MIRLSHLHIRSLLPALLIVLLLSVSSGHAQVWQWNATGGGSADDRFTSVTVDGSGNSAAIAEFTGDVTFNNVPLYAPYGGVAVAEYDPAGIPLWLFRISGTRRVTPGGVAFGPDGYLTVVGTYSGVISVDRENDTSAGGTDVFVLRLDRVGRTVWLRSLGGPGDDTASGVALDSNNNAVVVGTFTGSAQAEQIALFSTGPSDMFLASYKEDGSIGWARSDGGVGTVEPRAISIDGSGGIVIGGHAADSVSIAGSWWRAQGPGDGFVAAYTSEGIGRWSRAIGGDGDDAINTVGVDRFGTIYAGGGFKGTVALDHGPMTSNGGSDMCVIRLRTDGGTVWSRTWGTPNDESITAIAADNNGRLWAAGAFAGSIAVGAENYTSAGMEDMLYLTMNNTGDVLRTRTIGGGGSDIPHALATDGLGEVLLAGEFRGSFAVDSSAVQSHGMADCFIARDGAPTMINSVTIVDGGYCPGAEMIVRFTTTGRFSYGSNFRAELSDSAGSFANPRLLGAMKPNDKGIIYGKVPDSVIGSKSYRIRVVSTVPARTSPPNPIPIQLYGTMHPRITPSIPAVNDTVHICPGEWLLLDAGPWSDYFWSVIGNSRTLNISRPGRYYVIVKNEGDCEAYSPPLYVVYDTIRTPQISRIDQHRLECTTPAATYQWFRNGDTLRQQQNNFLNVEQDGLYTVEISTARGCTALSAPFTYQVADVVRGEEVPERITPQPVVDRAQLLLPRSIGSEAALTILDERGATVHTDRVTIDAEGHVLLDLSSLPAGHYLIQLSGDRGSWSGSFVKR